MTGWRLGDTLEHPELPCVYAFPKGFKLLEGADVRVHTWAGINDGQHLFWANDVPLWTSSGDRVRLVNAAEELVDSVSWPQFPPNGRVIRTDEIREDIARHATTLNPATSVLTGPFGTPRADAQWVVRPDDTEYFWQELYPYTVWSGGNHAAADPTAPRTG